MIVTLKYSWLKSPVQPCFSSEDLHTPNDSAVRTCLWDHQCLLSFWMDSAVRVLIIKVGLCDTSNTKITPMASLSLFVFWTLFISSHLILIHSVLFLARFKGTQVVKLIVILISCHTSLLLDINLSGPLLSTLASHWNTVAAQGHLQHISMINHHLSLRTDLPCMNSVCSGVWGHLHVERKTGRERERQKEREPEEDRKAALHWSCHEDELLDSLSHEYSLSWKAYCAYCWFRSPEIMCFI